MNVKAQPQKIFASGIADTRKLSLAALRSDKAQILAVTLEHIVPDGIDKQVPVAAFNSAI